MRNRGRSPNLLNSHRLRFEPLEVRRMLSDVSFGDSDLELAFRNELDIWGVPLTDVNLATATKLLASNSTIGSLEGIQFATGLLTLDLHSNQITDISQLSGLTNINTLDLDDNQINDISPLAGLPGLEVLELADNAISDISSLAGKPVLEILYLNNNNIVDLAAVQNMSSLTILQLDNNLVSDLTPVVNSTGLNPFPPPGGFVYVTGNPLSALALTVQIPELEAQLVTVYYDPNTPPVADAGGDAGGNYYGNEGSNITLDGSGSSDAEGPIAFYEWDLDNDGTFDVSGATAQTATFNSTDDGTFTVRLQVTDGNGATNPTTATVTVSNVAPTADAGGAHFWVDGLAKSNIYSTFKGNQITLNASGSTDPGNDILSYAWDLDNDGLYDATGVTTTFDATTAGTFTVKVRVTDKNVEHGTGTATVTVKLPGTDSIGLYDPRAVFHVKNDFSPGVVPDDWIVWGWGTDAGFLPIAGDWDGDGFDTIGLYDPNAVFHVKNDFIAGGVPDDWIVWGWGSTSGYYPIAGDWNGDGLDTIGLYSPTGVLSLKNDFTPGGADMEFQWGEGTSQDWYPVAGDWDGDGIDTVGVYAPNGVFLFKNDFAEESPIFWLSWGLGPDDGFLPIAGDWNGDGVDTIGLYDPNGVFSFKNDFSSGGAADDWLIWGWGTAQNWLPIHGNWNGDKISTLLAAGGEVAGAAEPLTQADLQPIVAEAIAGWAGVGLATDQLESLLEIDVIVADLPGTQLGLAARDAIYLDINAAGHGWFVDLTPGVNEEFQGEGLQATDPLAVDRMDLLTVVSHELGHTLGLEDLDPSSGSLMDSILETGLRREPGIAEIDALFAQL